MDPDTIKDRTNLALRAIRSLYGTPEGEFGPTLFVAHHLSEIDRTYWLRVTGAEQPSSDQVLSSLVFLNAWSAADNEIDTFDFGLPEDISNYLLSVHFGDDGKVDDVTMES